MPDDLGVTVVVINFRTADLTERAVSSFRQFYPSVPLLLVDNGSNNESVSTLHRLKDLIPEKTDLILNSQNLHHGPAMDQAIRRAQSPFVFFLDSDCEVFRGGFLEDMIGEFSRTRMAYAIGKKIFMNKRGFDVPESSNALPYIRPFFMMLAREPYLTFPPFVHHGTQCLENMTDARRKGYILLDFPVDQYVHHPGRGTAGRFGYGLGWRGKLNHLLNKFGF